MAQSGETIIGWFLEKYDKWSRYEPEETGVLIAYASMYGNTESAAQVLAAKLVEKGVKNVVVHDCFQYPCILPDQ